MVRPRQRRFVSLAIVSSASTLVFAMFAVVGTPAQTAAQTLTEDASAAPALAGPAPPWPCRLTVIGELRAVAEQAWQDSPTFRDQCRKLAAAGARVIVQPASSQEMWRAQTRIHRIDDGATIAYTRVRPSADSVELIAHELEHVVEYLEGIKFLMETHRGTSRVKLSGGAFETQRAINTGRRVAQEVRDATTGRRDTVASQWISTRSSRASLAPVVP
jgi:hypothetical protein